VLNPPPGSWRHSAKNSGTGRGRGFHGRESCTFRSPRDGKRLRRSFWTASTKSASVSSLSPSAPTLCIGAPRGEAFSPVCRAGSEGRVPSPSLRFRTDSRVLEAPGTGLNKSFKSAKMTFAEYAQQRPNAAKDWISRVTSGVSASGSRAVKASRPMS